MYYTGSGRCIGCALLVEPKELGKGLEGRVESELGRRFCRLGQERVTGACEQCQEATCGSGGR